MRSIAQPMQQMMVPMQQPAYQQPVAQAPMILVRTPTGQMGWVPASAVGATGQQGAAAKPAASMIKTVLTLGALGIAGWWAYKKWGHHLTGEEGGDDDREMAERGRGHSYERTRRRSRSRSRLLSEFKQFLDHNEAGEGHSSHRSREHEYATNDAHEDAHEAEEE